MNALVSAASDYPIVPRLRLLSNASSASTRSFGSFASDSSADIRSTNASGSSDDSDSFEEDSISEGLLRLAKAASTISSMEFSFAAAVSSPMMQKTTHVVSDYYSSPESESSAASTPPPSFVHVGQSWTSSDAKPPAHYAGLGSTGVPSLQHHMHNERPRMLMASGASSSAVYDTPAYPPRFSYSNADIESRSSPPNHYGHDATGSYPHPNHAMPSYPTPSSAPIALDSSALDSPHTAGPTIYGTPAVVVPAGGKSFPKKKRKYTKSGLYAKKTKPTAMLAKKPVVAIAANLALATTEGPKNKKDKNTTPTMGKKVKKSVSKKNKSGKGGKSSSKTAKAKKSTMKKMKSSSSKSQLVSRKKKVVQISNTTSLTDTLFQMLSDPDIQHITSWQRHGHAFDIHDKDAFVEKVLPLYFPYSRSKVANAKYTTFTRKLNRYGFKLMNRGKLAGGYHHPLFHRDRIELAQGIACESKPKTSRGK